MKKPTKKDTRKGYRGGQGRGSKDDEYKGGMGRGEKRQAAKSTALDVGKKQSGLTTGKLTTGNLEPKKLQASAVIPDKLNVGDQVKFKDGTTWTVSKVPPKS